MAEKARQTLGIARLVTTEEVVVEFLNALASDPHVRRQAILMAKAIMTSPDVHTVSQSHASFLRGLRLYEDRQDKNYSLTDCISMSLMRERRIHRVLTNDHHFAQEGFEILINN